MYNKDTLIQQLRQLLEIMKEKTSEVENFLKLIEGDTVLNMESIRESVKSGILTQIQNNENYPDYPFKDDLLAKLRYFDEIISRVWMVQEFKDFIVKVESKKSEITLKNFSQKLIYLINKGEIFVMKYNNSNKYAFYSAHPEWVQKNGKHYQLVTGREPDKKQISGLTLTQRQSEKIVWKGLIKI